MAEEIGIAERSDVSPSRLKLIAPYFRIPENVQGMTILDTGSGPSTTVKELREKGANAVGVDYNYKDMRGLKRASIRFVRQSGLRAPELKGLRTDLEKTQNQFLDDYNRIKKSGNVPYFAGLAGKLPFADNTFDLAYSSGCISTVLISAREVLIKSILEGVRVIKPGKTLQIAPWNIPPWDENAKRNASIALQSLRERNIPFSIEVIPGEESGCLIITKPADAQTE